MKTIVLRFVAGCILLLCIGFVITSVDWFAYGPAQAPARQEISTELAKLEALSIGNVNALEAPVSLQWSQYVPVKVTAQGAPDTFEEDRNPRSVFGRSRKGPTRSDRLGASIFIRIERKSSLGEGSACVSACGSGASVDSKQVLNWSGQLGIPNVPGNYLGRVLVVFVDPGSGQLNEILIGDFPLEVVPGPESSD